MHIVRMIGGAPFAAAITLALFLFMATTVSQHAGAVPEIEDRPEIIVTIQEKPEPRPLPVRPDPLSQVPPETDTRQTRGHSQPAPRLPKPDAGGDNLDILKTLGPVGAPVIKIAPPYPERCLGRNVEGVVIVKFDILADGSVTNLRIVSSPDRCFESSVINAVQNWKYAPAYVEGMPRPRYSVTEQFLFKIDG